MVGCDLQGTARRRRQGGVVPNGRSGGGQGRRRLCMHTATYLDALLAFARCLAALARRQLAEETGPPVAERRCCAERLQLHSVRTAIPL